MSLDELPQREVVEIDLSAVRSSEDASHQLCSHLNLWLCNNSLDSLWDSISGADMPKKLVVYGMDHVDRLYPHDADLLRGALRIGLESEAELELVYAYELKNGCPPAISPTAV